MAQYYTAKHASLRLIFSCSQSLHDPSFLNVLAECGFTMVSCQVAEREKCELVNLHYHYRDAVHNIWLYRPLANAHFAVAYFYGPARAELAMLYNATFLFVPLKHIYFLLDAYETLPAPFFEEICQTLVLMLQPEDQVRYLDNAGYIRIKNLLMSGDIRYASSAMTLMLLADPERGIALLKEVRDGSADAAFQSHCDHILSLVPDSGNQPLVSGQLKDDEQMLLPFFACCQFPDIPIDQSVAEISTGYDRHKIMVDSLTLMIQVHALKRSDAEFSRVQWKDYTGLCYALYFNGTDWPGFWENVRNSSVSFLPEELLRTVLVTTDQDDFFQDAAYCLLLCTTAVLIDADSYDPRESLNYYFLEQVKDQLSPGMKEAMAALIP